MLILFSVLFVYFVVVMFLINTGVYHASDFLSFCFYVPGLIGSGVGLIVAITLAVPYTPGC